MAVLPTTLNLFKICCLNLEELNEPLHVLISAIDPVKVLPTTRFPLKLELAEPGAEV